MALIMLSVSVAAVEVGEGELEYGTIRCERGDSISAHFVSILSKSGFECCFLPDERLLLGRRCANPVYDVS